MATLSGHVGEGALWAKVLSTEFPSLATGNIELELHLELTGLTPIIFIFTLHINSSDKTTPVTWRVKKL